MRKCRIHLTSWDKSNLEIRINSLEKEGFEVLSSVPSNRDFFAAVESENPNAIVIDLERSPSQGRDIAVTFRTRKTSRAIPIVFVGGKTVEEIRKLLPDATFTTWEKISMAIKQAYTHPLLNPLVPSSIFAAYSDVPLAKKLGIKADSNILALHAPPALDSLLGDLPEGATLCQDSSLGCDIVLWFIRSQKELRDEIVSISSRQDLKSLWMIWPKKTSTFSSDLTQKVVRETGLSHALVDYKICSLDTTWTGLCFAKRKKLGRSS